MVLRARALLAASQADGNSTLLTAPRLTFNGQRGLVKVVTSTAHVSGIERIAEADGKQRFEPRVGNLESGIVLDCQPRVSSDRKSVTLTLRPRLTNLLTMDSVAAPDVPAERKDLMIQIPKVQTAQYDGTVPVPDQATAAILLHPTITGQGAAQAPAGPVLLLATTTLTDKPDQQNFPGPLP